ELAPLLELPIVGSIHGKGLMIGIELVRSKTTREPLRASGYALAQRMRREAGILLGGMKNTWVLLPPLVISKEQVTQLATGVGSVLRDFAKSPEVKAELAAR